MLWIDIGIYCGYTRKMEIAESHFQPLCNVSLTNLSCSADKIQALRRAGAFDRAMYDEIVPTAQDDSTTLSEKWHKWVRQESFKR